MPERPHPHPLELCYEHEGEDGRVCVSPELQFKTKSTVHWLPADPSKPGWRFHLLVEDGFAQHPAIVPSTDKDAADFVLYLPVSTRTPVPVANSPHRLIVMDEGDGAGAYPRVKEDSYLAYAGRAELRALREDAAAVLVSPSDVDMPWSQVAATPRPRTRIVRRRGDAAAATRLDGPRLAERRGYAVVHKSRRRRGRGRG